MSARRGALLILAGAVLAPLAIQALRRSVEPLTTDYPLLSMLETPRAPGPFEFLAEHGGRYTLAKFAGRKVLLNVWATWCPPCRDELPSLDRLKAILQRDGGITVIALSVDIVSFEQLRTFYKAYSIHQLEIYRGDEHSVMNALSVFGLPTTIMLNSQGLEVARLVGPTKWDNTEVISGVLRAAGMVPR